MYLEIDNEKYKINVIKKARNKNTYIRVNDDLEIVVTTSIFTTLKEIEKINEKETRKRISSPYTRKKVRKAKMKLVYFFSILTIILVSATLIFLNVFLSSKKELNYNIGSEITYEFAK